MQTFETRIVLKYPSPPEANQPNRVFVAIDYLSGGYPYAVPIGKAHEFYDYEAASKYRDAVASRGTFELCVGYLRATYFGIASDLEYPREAFILAISVWNALRYGRFRDAGWTCEMDAEACAALNTGWCPGDPL